MAAARKGHRVRELSLRAADKEKRHKAERIRELNDAGVSDWFCFAGGLDDDVALHHSG
jgi:hypothetical protein